MNNLRKVEPRMYGINEKELPYNSYVEYNTTESLELSEFPVHQCNQCEENKGEKSAFEDSNIELIEDL